MEELGLSVPDKRYKVIVLRSLPVGYERVRVASFKKRNRNPADIRHMVSALYIDYLSRSNATNLVAGRGVAMPTSERSDGGREAAKTCFSAGSFPVSLGKQPIITDKTNEETANHGSVHYA